MKTMHGFVFFFLHGDDIETIKLAFLFDGVTEHCLEISRRASVVLARVRVGEGLACWFVS